MRIMRNEKYESDVGIVHERRKTDEDARLNRMLRNNVSDQKIRPSSRDLAREFARHIARWRCLGE
jgi:hypothetical protein